MRWRGIQNVRPLWIKNNENTCYAYLMQTCLMVFLPVSVIPYRILHDHIVSSFHLLCVEKRTGHVAYLLGGFGFGLLLEYVNVVSNAGYRYGQFWLMLGPLPDNIPVCIGMGWGIIIYTSRLVSDNRGLPLTAAAAFDALLALSIDLSMDVVAYRLHMWHWDWGSLPGGWQCS